METIRMHFADYIDQEVTLLIPFIDAKLLQTVRVRGVEPGGIWVESQTLMNLILGKIRAASSPKTLAFFFPYSAITFGFVGIEGPGLNEKAFDV
jgi:hypothetical protein